MIEKTFKIVGRDISDGYHTFDELYAHRCLLFICWMASDGCPGKTYWIEDHFDGWDLLVCSIPDVDQPNPDEQISYHIPKKFRELLRRNFEKVAATDHKWNGHTAADVVEFMLTWAGVQ